VGLKIYPTALLLVSKPFKHQPNGYRGVGEAILNAVKERQVLLQEEARLSLTGTSTSEKPPYICDFSDGEHGHELFSWQHRFCGSDASVHLGGARLLRGMGSSKKSLKSSTGGSTKNISPAVADITSRLTKIFEKAKQTSDSNKDKTKEAQAGNIASLLDAYSQILSDTELELKSLLVSLNGLYARKLVLHLIIAYSDKFTPSLFTADESPMSEDVVCRQLYTILENSASNSTWLGEAGSMAVAAEALGLGISTYDATNPDGSPNGMCTVTGDHVILAGGISQFLSSAALIKTKKLNNDGIYTPWTFVAVSCFLTSEYHCKCGLTEHIIFFSRRRKLLWAAIVEVRFLLFGMAFKMRWSYPRHCVRLFWPGSEEQFAF
jgi:hypothetical protein